MAGGAPLSPETHEFVRTVMGCPILQAYGLTETCANTTAMDIHDNSTGAVGPPNQGVHIKLVNWEEGNYRCRNRMRILRTYLAAYNTALGLDNSSYKLLAEFCMILFLLYYRVTDQPRPRGEVVVGAASVSEG